MGHDGHHHGPRNSKVQALGEVSVQLENATGISSNVTSNADEAQDIKSDHSANDRAITVLAPCRTRGCGGPPLKHDAVGEPVEMDGTHGRGAGDGCQDVQGGCAVETPDHGVEPGCVAHAGGGGGEEASNHGADHCDDGEPAAGGGVRAMVRSLQRGPGKAARGGPDDEKDCEALAPGGCCLSLGEVAGALRGGEDEAVGLVNNRCALAALAPCAAVCSLGRAVATRAAQAARGQKNRAEVAADGRCSGVFEVGAVLSAPGEDGATGGGRAAQVAEARDLACMGGVAPGVRDG